MRKLYTKFKNNKFVYLFTLTIISLVAGISLLFKPDDVSNLIIRGIGLLWVFEGVLYLLDLITLIINNKKIQQFFCRHNYEIPKEYDDYEERNRLVSELKEGESISFSRIHRCTKCSKEKMIGSGTFI